MKYSRALAATCAFSWLRPEAKQQQPPKEAALNSVDCGLGALWRAKWVWRYFLSHKLEPFINYCSLQLVLKSMMDEAKYFSLLWTHIFWCWMEEPHLTYHHAIRRNSNGEGGTAALTQPLTTNMPSILFREHSCAPFPMPAKKLPMWQISTAMRGTAC